VLSIVGGPVDTTDSKTLALPVDDKGVYPFKLQRLLALDVDSQDFVFQQGKLQVKWFPEILNNLKAFHLTLFKIV
jgi:hypothetical protein